MSFLLKSLSPDKDAVLVTLAARDFIQELWESRRWVNPRVFLKSAQAVLACLCVQALGEEDSVENLEMQWSWEKEGLKHLYADSLFQGAIRTNYSWYGDESEELAELKGIFKVRKSFKQGEGTGNVSAFETSGIVDSSGDIVRDVQDILLKSDQKDCAMALSVRWDIDDSMDTAKLKITFAHAYLLHVLPSPIESQRDLLLEKWQNFLTMLRSPAEWVLPEDSQKAAEEMTHFIFASTKGSLIFSKKPTYFCNCTEERIIGLMKVLSKEDLESLAPTFDVECKYCGKNYLVEKVKSGLA
ncbi:MAG: Hsp33 family molecular chaperone HslO [Bdellovibrionota bacterium]